MSNKTDVRLAVKHHLHPFSDNAELKKHGVRMMVKAKGIYVYDSDGNEIIDGMAGLWCVNIGYGEKNWLKLPRNKCKCCRFTILSSKQPILQSLNYRKNWLKSHRRDLIMCFIPTPVLNRLIP